MDEISLPKNDQECVDYLDQMMFDHPSQAERYEKQVGQALFNLNQNGGQFDLWLYWAQLNNIDIDIDKYYYYWTEVFI